MKTLKCIPILALSCMLVLTACSEGAVLPSTTESGAQTASEASDTVDTGSETDETNRLETPLTGGVYQVESWTLKDTPADAGLIFDKMSPSVEEKDFQSMKNLLLVTMNYTSTKDSEGNVEKTALVNNFCLVPTDALQKLPKDLTKSEDFYNDFGQIQDASVAEPVYLDCGKPGQDTYFEMATPSEGETKTYTMAYSLPDDIMKQAENGNLSLCCTEGINENYESLPLTADLRK